MKKKLQVFISSTYTDMLPERQAAVEAILRARHIPAGMELFAAGDESQLETIRRWIDDSDLFMLILGGRYGSLEPKSGKSYIELEYDYAVKQKKPLFAAVINDQYLEAKVKAGGTVVIEKTNGHLLAAFRDKVTKRICRFFENVDQLKLIVFESIANIEWNEDLPGWIHGSDVIDPKATLEEIDRLQGENAELRREFKEFEAQVAATLGATSGVSAADAISEDAKRLLLAAKAQMTDRSSTRFMGAGRAYRREARISSIHILLAKKPAGKRSSTNFAHTG